MKTLKQMKNDPRIYEICRVSGEDFNDPQTKYEINLNDGYMFRNGGGVEYAANIKELNDLLNEIIIDNEG